jgi:hypothetical protein
MYDVEGNILKGKKMYIDASGLQGGMRKMRDGHAFFGIIDKIVV